MAVLALGVCYMFEIKQSANALKHFPDKSNYSRLKPVTKTDSINKFYSSSFFIKSKFSKAFIKQDLNFIL